MSITVEWDHTANAPEQSILYWTFEEGWNWHDFGEADRRAYSMALSVTHRVDSIVDFRRSQRLPRSGALSHFARSVTKSPPNRGVVVIVQPGAMIRAVEKVLRRLYPAFAHQYVIADTLEDAYTLIAERLEKEAPQNS